MLSVLSVAGNDFKGKFSSPISSLSELSSLTSEAPLAATGEEEDADDETGSTCR